MATTKHWTRQDIPDLSGRTAVVTGANTGLGLETVRALGASGAAVILAVRDLDKGKAAIDAITADHKDAKLSLQALDLASLASVRSAAEELRSRCEQIDLLVNNAGVMWTPKSTTADGFELQFGTNHLGHFAFTGLLLEKMLTVHGSRVVTVSSIGHRIRSAIDFDDLNGDKNYNRVSAYGRSKLGNLLFTYELQRRLSSAGTETNALAAHPGASDTELTRYLPAFVLTFQGIVGRLAQTPAMGALPTLRAATDPNAAGGEYFGPDGFTEARGHPVVVGSSKRARDGELQRQLWKTSEELTGVSYPV